MNPEFAVGLRGFLLQSLNSEIPATEKVVLAMPEGQMDFAPDAKSTPALKLAFHIVSSEIAFLEFAVNGSMDRFMAAMPEDIKGPADVVAYRNANRAAALAAVEAMSGDELVSNRNFFGAFNYPAVVYLQWANIHSIHHRGQLSAYLRSMGGKVPSIYGGSADEPFQMAASS